MLLDTNMIVNFVKIFVINMGVYYSFEKIININEKRINNYLILLGVNVGLVFAYVKLKSVMGPIMPFMLIYFLYAIIISKLTNSKLGQTMIITIIGYAILLICNTVSIAIQFIPYKLIYKLFNIESIYLSLLIISVIEFILLYSFFKIKRFKNGFVFLKNKLNNEITDIIMINISTIVILIYSLAGTHYEQMKWGLLISFLILGIVMFFSIKKMITMYYKQKLLMDTMEEYKKELTEKQDEIDRLKSEKQNVSKITHEFYNRQKALELLVASNMNADNIDKENVSANVLNIIESLTNEYSQRYESMKELPKLEITDIPEIDNMFKYMQSECDKNNINFKLKIMGNIHSLVNNVIPLNKLETLIGDHLRDAINAVNLSESENKEILAVLGIKNKKYELAVFDSGVDFEIDTLLKLGLEAVTTNKDRGGTGTGFMTTFETLNETKASLVITEYPLGEGRLYAKCVCIRFDGKREYRIYSHRAEEIKQKITDKRIKIEEYNK